MIFFTINTDITSSQPYWFPTDGPAWSDYLTALGLLGLLVGAIWTYREFERRRRERVEIRQFELAEQVLSLFYEGEIVFDQVRNPIGHSGEGKSRNRENTTNLDSAQNDKIDREYASIERLERFTEYFERCYKLLPTIKALFGESIFNAFGKIFKIRNDIVWASEASMDAVNDSWATGENWKEWRAIRYARSKDDPIKTTLEEAKTELEEKLLPLMKSRFN